MAKHRKTRKQKARSDLRQQLVMTPAQTTDEIPSSEEAKPFRFTLPDRSQPTQTTSPHGLLPTYAYVTHDLKKTTLITSAIIIAQLTLFLAMR